MLQQQGKDTSPLDLWQLMSTPPCRAHDTIYTVAMHPASGLLVTRSVIEPEHEQQGSDRWGDLAAEATRGYALSSATRQ